MDGDRIGQTDAVDHQCPNPLGDLVEVSSSLGAPRSGCAIAIHELELVIPDDQATVAVQEFIPDTVLLPGSAREGGSDHGSPRRERANNLDVVANIVRFEEVQ